VTDGCLAEGGHEVVCKDTDRGGLAMLEGGRVPIYEPHLEAVLAAARRAGRLTFTGHAGEAVRAGDAIFICVGTPPRQTGEADLSAIDNVARLIATEARSPKLVIEKSTVPAQTGLQLKRASNSVLALKSSYANVLADLCERLGANVEEVTRAMGLDPRIGPQFLRAGLGFGGFCLPKDIQAFIWLAESVGVDFGLLKE